MAEVSVKISEIEKVLRRRIMRRIGQFTSESPAYKSAILRIAFQLESETKLNIRRERLIDTGRLLNSIRFKIRKDGNKQEITAGSFGVPYAAVHEFGFDGVVKIREHRRLVTKAFGKSISPVSATVSSHDRKMVRPKRAFLEPAFKKVAPNAVEILRDLFRLK